MPAEDAPHDARIEVFLDDATRPFAVHHPPARFELDTRALRDGPHVLRFEAEDGTGRRGVRTVSFTVRNGPGIAIDGVQEGDVVEGRVALLVNAYGAGYEERWEPARAETPAPAPTWVWVLLLALVAWAMYYAVRHWSPPPGDLGMHHAAEAPGGVAAPALLAVAIALVIGLVAASAHYLLRPGERDPDHIKRRILD